MEFEEGIAKLQDAKRMIEGLLEDCGHDAGAKEMLTNLLNELDSTIEAVTSASMSQDELDKFLGKE